MGTVELCINSPEGLHDQLIAALDEIGFEAYLQEDEMLKAYIRENLWDTPATEQLSQVLSTMKGNKGWSEKVIPDQDWNEPWEQSIHPIQTRNFYIRPGWVAEVESVTGLIDIQIDPKMSFGTGHHETTRLILDILPDLMQPGIRVLDAGAGTGVLAIASIKLGARSAIAFDIDTWAYTNAKENTAKNDVTDQVDVREGGIDVVSEHSFDLILANINRNVLLEYGAEFAKKLAGNGHLVLSGLLIEDVPVVEAAYREVSLYCEREVKEEAWAACVFRKNGTIK